MSEMAMTPIMHTIGVPIQALESTSEMAMTPMGIRRRRLRLTLILQVWIT